MNKDKYADIIDLKPFRSKKHPPMPISDRAAQFSPFAALSGFEEEIKETSRFTQRRHELSEDQKDDLDRKLNYLFEHIKQKPSLTITYFVPDLKKVGGSYTKKISSLKKIDTYKRLLILSDNTAIAIDDIDDIEIKM